MKARKVFSSLLLAALVLPASVSAAGFSYGSIAVAPGSNQAVLTYRTIDARQAQVCNLATFACDPNGTSTPALSGEIGSGSYTLSPSGKLAFVPESDAAGNAVNRVYQVANGTLANPVTLPVSGAIRSILFAPDDSRAVARTSAALVSLDLRTGALLGSVAWNAQDHFSFAKISPDARYIAYFTPGTQSRPARSFRIVDIVKAKTYTLAETLKYWDLLSEQDTLFQFSQDGAFLLYKDDREGPDTLYKVDLAKLKGTAFKGARLFSRSYNVADFMLADARTLLYIANRADAMRYDLFSYDLKTSVLKTVAENVSYYPPLKRAGNLVIFNRLVSWGSEVVAYDLATKSVRTFPQPAGPFATLKPGTDLALPGGVHGALLLPDGFNPKQPHQLLVWLHGGPARQASLGYHPYPSYGVYDWMLEGLRASGVVVLKLDYTGSVGYGRAFAEALKDNVGVKDAADVLSAVAALKKKYSLSQTYLMGVSYGGYLALRALVQQPASFAGAVSVNGVTSWTDLVNGNPDTIFAADFRGPLTAANEKLYDRASILAKTPQLTTQKVVLLHSRNDGTVSYSQSSMLAGILQTAGKQVQFTTLPDDDHVFQHRSNVITVCTTAFQTLGLAAGEHCVLNSGTGAAASGSASAPAPPAPGI